MGAATEWQRGSWRRQAAGTWDSGAEEERPAGEREAVAEEGGEEARRRWSGHGDWGDERNHRESCMCVAAGVQACVAVWELGKEVLAAAAAAAALRRPALRHWHSGPLA
jgi:hypothetical protein